jgi:hypothetical protein
MAINFDAERKLDDDLVEKALKQLRAAFNKIPNTADFTVAQDLLTEVLEDLIVTYGDVVASNALDLFLRIRAEAGITSAYTGVLVNEVNKKQLHGSVKYAFASFMYKKDPDRKSALNVLEGALDRHIRGANRQTLIANSSKKSSKAGGWRRVTSSTSECQFCLLLASRGAVYYSAESAGLGNKFHDHDRCLILPDFDGMEYENTVTPEEAQTELDRRAEEAQKGA